MSLATVGIALPNFVIASLAIMVFVFAFQCFRQPAGGRFARSCCPPSVSGTAYAAEIARIVRTGMLDVLSQDYHPHRPGQGT